MAHALDLTGAQSVISCAAGLGMLEGRLTGGEHSLRLDQEENGC